MPGMRYQAVLGDLDASVPALREALAEVEHATQATQTELGTLAQRRAELLLGDADDSQLDAADRALTLQQRGFDRLELVADALRGRLIAAGA